MSGFKRFLVLHLDKVLVGIFLIWALSVSFRCMVDLTGVPEAVKKAEDEISRLKRIVPPTPKFEEYNLLKNYMECDSWRVGTEPIQRDLFYKVEPIVAEIETEMQRYKDLLKTHEHKYLDVAGTKICIFPGCVKSKDEDKIGPCKDFKCVESSVTTITLEWLDPEDLGSIAIHYCLVERRKAEKGQDAEKGWTDVLDEKGKPVRVLAGQDQILGEEASTAPDAPEGGAVAPQPGAGGARPAGTPDFMPPGMDPDFMMPMAPPGMRQPGQKPRLTMPPRPARTAPAASVETEDPELTAVREIVGAGAPKEMLGTLKGADAEKKREVMKLFTAKNLTETKAAELLQRLVAETEEAALKSTKYKLVDFNLDPGVAYEYRIRALGSNAAGLEIKGDWTRPLPVSTKEDRGVRFKSLRPEVLAPDGKVLSPQTVAVTINKLYSPPQPWPWEKVVVRYFLSWDHTDLQPGVADKTQVGRLVHRLQIVDRDGKTVYYNKATKEFTNVPPPADSKNISPYTEKIDFTTNWIVDKVEERVSKINVKEKKMDGNGRPVEVTVSREQYRYILLLKDKTDAKMTIELELPKTYSKSIFPTPPNPQ